MVHIESVVCRPTDQDGYMYEYHVSTVLVLPVYSAGCLLEDG